MGSQVSHLEERLKKACQTRHLSLSGLYLEDLNRVVALCYSRNPTRKLIPLFQVQLCVLDLSRNRLKTLPELHLMYAHLRICFLFDNRFESLPNHFCRSVPLLERLDVSHNRLKCLPEAIEELRSLRELNLSNNQLHDIPIGLGRLPHLELLNLAENQLEVLPEMFGLEWNRLSELNLRKNQLKRLPNVCRGWIRLRVLLLDINFLDRLPQDIFQSTPQLVMLSLDDNPLLSMTTNIESLPNYADYMSRRKAQIDKKLHANLPNIKLIHRT